MCTGDKAKSKHVQSAQDVGTTEVTLGTLGNSTITARKAGRVAAATRLASVVKSRTRSMVTKFAPRARADIWDGPSLTARSQV